MTLGDDPSTTDEGEGGPLTAPTTNSGRAVDIFGLGCALSAALLAVFAICLPAALILPTLPFAAAWVGLFTVSPLTSLAVWLEGILASIAVAWVVAAVAGFVYNRVVG